VSVSSTRSVGAPAAVAADLRAQVWTGWKLKRN
jgi:hypothetical protein